jgi:hypothetical protein
MERYFDILPSFIAKLSNDTYHLFSNKFEEDLTLLEDLKDIIEDSIYPDPEDQDKIIYAQSKGLFAYDLKTKEIKQVKRLTNCIGFSGGSLITQFINGQCRISNLDLDELEFKSSKYADIFYWSDVKAYSITSDRIIILRGEDCYLYMLRHNKYRLNGIIKNVQGISVMCPLVLIWTEDERSVILADSDNVRMNQMSYEYTPILNMGIVRPLCLSQNMICESENGKKESYIRIFINNKEPGEKGNFVLFQTIRGEGKIISIQRLSGSCFTCIRDTHIRTLEIWKLQRDKFKIYYKQTLAVKSIHPLNFENRDSTLEYLKKSLIKNLSMPMIKIIVKFF